MSNATRGRFRGRNYTTRRECGAKPPPLSMTTYTTTTGIISKQKEKSTTCLRLHVSLSRTAPFQSSRPRGLPPVGIFFRAILRTVLGRVWLVRRRAVVPTTRGRGIEAGFLGRF